MSEIQESVWKSYICDIRYDIKHHRSRPLARVANRHHAVLEDPTDNRQEEQQPATEASIVCGRTKTYEHDSHDGKADAVRNEHDTGDGSRPFPPRNYAASIAAVSTLDRGNGWIPPCRCQS